MTGDDYYVGLDDHPWIIAEALIECSADPQGENAAIVANILSISPLHALVGKGHSARYVPWSPPKTRHEPKVLAVQRRSEKSLKDLLGELDEPVSSQPPVEDELESPDWVAYADRLYPKKPATAECSNPAELDGLDETGDEIP